MTIGTDLIIVVVIVIIVLLSTALNDVSAMTSEEVRLYIHGLYSQTTTEVDLRARGVSHVPSKVFRMLPFVRSLYINRNIIEELEDDIFDGMRDLRALDIQDNGLRRISPYAFRGIGSNMRSLNLFQNQIHELPECVFNGLSTLRELALNDNCLEALPENVFRDLSSLSSLWLHGNHLEMVPVGMAVSLHSIRVLTLHDNHLHSLPEGFFYNMTKLRSVTLRENPWHCCGLRWLQDWIKEHPGIIREPDRVICESPGSVTGLPVKDVDWNDIESECELLDFLQGLRCGAQPLKAGASSVCSGNTYGHSCVFHCEDGFTGPPESLSCLATGKWQIAKPSMACAVTTCPPLPPRRQGVSIDCTGSTYGNVCWYTCEYDPEPKKRRERVECRASGRWTVLSDGFCSNVSISPEIEALLSQQDVVMRRRLGWLEKEDFSNLENSDVSRNSGERINGLSMLFGAVVAFIVIVTYCILAARHSRNHGKKMLAKRTDTHKGLPSYSSLPSYSALASTSIIPPASDSDNRDYRPQATFRIKGINGTSVKPPNEGSIALASRRHKPVLQNAIAVMDGQSNNRRNDEAVNETVSPSLSDANNSGISNGVMKLTESYIKTGSLRDTSDNCDLLNSEDKSVSSGGYTFVEANVSIDEEANDNDNNIKGSTNDGVDQKVRGRRVSGSFVIPVLSPKKINENKQSRLQNRSLSLNRPSPPLNQRFHHNEISVENNLSSLATTKTLRNESRSSSNSSLNHFGQFTSYGGSQSLNSVHQITRQEDKDWSIINEDVEQLQAGHSRARSMPEEGCLG